MCSPQAIALVITLYTQQDFAEGCDLWIEGYDVFENAPHPHMTRTKFHISVALRIFNGLVGILVTFLLVIGSNEAVDLLLNFSAMEFVATLDGVAFELAAAGYLGRVLESKAEEVSIAKYKSHKDRRTYRKWPHLVVAVLLLIGGIWLFLGQMGRRFGENELYVQFQDDVVPELASLSGVYVGVQEHFNSGGRGQGPVYYERKGDSYITDPEFKKPRFYYCQESQGEELNAWVFHFYDPRTLRKTHRSPKQPSTGSHPGYR